MTAKISKYINKNWNYEHDIEFYKSLRKGDYIKLEKSQCKILKVIEKHYKDAWPIKVVEIYRDDYKDDRLNRYTGYRFSKQYTHQYRKMNKLEVMAELL